MKTYLQSRRRNDRSHMAEKRSFSDSESRTLFSIARSAHNVLRPEFRLFNRFDQKATSPMLIHFVPTNKVTRNDKLGATFNAMVLSKSQRGEINLVRLVHGHHWTILSAKASTLFVCRARSYQICASRKKANRANVDNTRFPQLAVRRKENCGTENSLESCDKPSILFTAFVHSERVEHLRAS